MIGNPVLMRALIFAHFDRDGLLDPYVLNSMKTYRDHFDRVILSSPSLKKCPPELRPFVDDFVARENTGYDFGSWADGNRKLVDPDSYDEIFFINDSVYGPLSNDQSFLRFGEEKQLDFWGMVYSNQSPIPREIPETPHVQSWFFALNQAAYRSSAFQKFLENIQPQPSKKDVVLNYEIGLSKALSAAAFSVGALYDYRHCERVRWRELLPHMKLYKLRRNWKAIRRYNRLTCNPSELRVEYLWKLGVPYLKVGVMRVNHYKLNLEHIMRQLESTFDYDTNLIKQHMQRVCRP